MMYSPASVYDDDEWQQLRDRIAPWIGERAVTLFAAAVASGCRNAAWAALFHDRVVDAGDDPETPQVTETEQLLIDWGRLIADGADIPPAFESRLDGALSPERRAALSDFAASMLREGARKSGGSR